MDTSGLEGQTMVKKLPDRIRIMHGMYGKVEGKACRDCDYFLRAKWHDKVHFKCRLNKMTHGPATDWRALWPACGRINNGETKGP